MAKGKHQPQDVGHRGFYSIYEVQEKFPVSRATLYRRMRLGQFPRGVRITSKRFGWWKDEIDAYCEQLLKPAA